MRFGRIVQAASYQGKPDPNPRRRYCIMLKYIVEFMVISANAGKHTVQGVVMRKEDPAGALHCSRTDRLCSHKMLRLRDC